MPHSSIRDQIALKRAEARSARNTPSPSASPARPTARATTGYGAAASNRYGHGPQAQAAPSFGSPSRFRRAAPQDEMLEESNVPGQVAKARRSGKLDLSSLDLTAIPPLVYTDLLGIPEDELSVPPPKPQDPTSKPSSDGQSFEARLANLDLEADQRDSDTQRRAFGQPERRVWTEPEELTSLRAYDNKITRLELEIGLFGGLKTLDLHNNNLAVLPHAIADLLRLTWIDLSHNKLTTLSPALLLLPELESINLSHNSITTIDLTSPVKPSEEGLAYGTGFLTTSFERAAKAPKTVLPLLRSLNLAHNELTVPSLAGLSGNGELHLRVLNLSHNNLSGVLDAAPAGVDKTRMPDLASLVLGGNAHLNELKGSVAAGCAIDTEGCAWGQTGGASTSLGASPGKAKNMTNDASATPTYTPAPGGPNDVPTPTLTLPFITHPAATFDSEPLAVEMDIYLPPNVSSPTTAHPVIIWWHGGGLLQGNKENLPPHLRRLPSKAVNGQHCVVISPNYRLAPQAPILDVLQDTDAAVTFVRTKLNDRLAAAEYATRVDPSRIILSGGSAGGYLAMMAGLSVPKSVPDADVGGHRGPAGWTPLGIAPFYPITDLEHVFWATKTDPVPWWGQSVPDSAARPHLNHRDPPVSSAVSGGPRSILYPYMLQHALFPSLLFYNQRSRGSGLDSYRPNPESMGVTKRLKLLAKYGVARPPLYLVYGTIDDKIQPLDETVQLVKATKGPDAVIEVLEGADHGFDENAAEQCPGFEAWLKTLL